MQAEDRAHRIGQKKQVVVFRFITEDAIEEKVIERATQKLRLDQLVIQQGKASQQSKAASKDELLGMIQHGAESIFRQGGSTIAQDAIEDILAKGEEKTKRLEKRYQTMGLDDLQKFTSDGGGSAFEWEGQNYAEKVTFILKGGEEGALGPLFSIILNPHPKFHCPEYFCG